MKGGAFKVSCLSQKVLAYLQKCAILPDIAFVFSKPKVKIETATKADYFLVDKICLKTENLSDELCIMLLLDDF